MHACRSTLEDPTDRIPVRRDTVFDIASLSKAFTAVTMLRLVAQGRARLEDPLSRWLPEAPADKRAITVEQLLSHTAGLERDFPFENPTSRDYEEVSRDEAVRRVFAQPVAGPPGAAFAYSNSGFVLAAAVVEAAGGAPFRDVVRREVIKPLRLASTGFWGPDVALIPDDRLARSYDEDGQTANLRNRSGTTWCDLGGGSMISTIDDMHAFFRGVRDGALLPAELRRRMWTPVKADYGLGWFIADSPVGKRISHGGDFVGFGSEIAFYPDHDLVLCHVANRANQDLGTRHTAGRVAPLIYLGRPPVMWAGEPFDLPPRWISGADALAAIAGTWRLSSGDELVVRRKDVGTFEIGARGQGAADLLLCGTPEAKALRASSTERALTFVRAALAGDEAAMTPILRQGGPVADYRASISEFANDPAMGRLLAVEPIGTMPYALPRHSRMTKLRLRSEKGERVIHFGWSPDQDRIMYWGIGTDLVAATPLRETDDGGMVGWNIVTGRGLKIRLVSGSLEVRNGDGETAVAARA